MRKRDQEWREDVDASQRNVIFPDTVRNEGRLWRNLRDGKQKLTIVQGIGVAVVFLSVITVFWMKEESTFRSGASGSVYNRLVPVFVDLGIVLGVLIVGFLLLRWRVRR